MLDTASPTSEQLTRTVVHLIDMVPNKRGPVELQLLETGRQWVARGGRMLCFFTSPPPTWYAQLLDAAGVGYGTIDRTRWDKSAARIIETTAADIVHFHFGSAKAARLAKRHNRYFGRTEHSFRNKRTFETARRAVRFLRQRHLDFIICVSEFIRAQTLEDFLAPPKKVHKVLNATDLLRFAPRPADKDHLRADLLGLSPDCIVITIAAHMIPRKRHELLVEALPIVLKEVPLARVVLAGDGPLRDSLAARAAQLGLQENILILSGDNDVALIYAASDIAVLPSWGEGLPGSGIEAIASGLPLVATANGANQEIYEENVSGLTVHQPTPEELALRILQLCTDPARRQSMGYQARLRAEGLFSVQQSAASLIAVYDALPAR